MKVKIDVTVNGFGIVKGQILSSENLSEQYLSSLVLNDLGHYVQDNEINQSEVDDYQEKTYPDKFLVLRNGNMYRASVGAGNFTSSEWIDNEWVLKIKGSL